jgi:hypothetical protein
MDKATRRVVAEAVWRDSVTVAHVKLNTAGIAVSPKYEAGLTPKERKHLKQTAEMLEEVNQRLQTIVERCKA